MPEPYIKHLAAIAQQDVAVVTEKDAQYGASWLEYGGLSAFFVAVRKWDRMRVQLKKVGYDVFEAYRVDQRQEGFMDDVRDFRRYLLLWEGQARVLGLVPADQGYFQFGESMVVCDEARLRLAIRALLTGPDAAGQWTDGAASRTVDEEVNAVIDKVKVVDEELPAI